MGTINLRIFHGEGWVESPNIVYESGKVEEMNDFEVDHLSFFELQWYCNA